MKKALASLCLAWVLCIGGRLAGLAKPQAAQPVADDTLLNQGLALLAQGKYDAAVATFNAYKQKSPLDPRAYFYTGMALTQAGQLPPAAAELKEAVRLAPDQLTYRIFEANVYSRLKHTTQSLQALAVFDSHDYLKQLTPVWLHLLSDVYFRLELPDKALAVLNVLKVQNPDDARTNYELGRVYAYKNELDQAIQSYKKSEFLLIKYNLVN